MKMTGMMDKTMMVVEKGKPNMDVRGWCVWSGTEIGSFDGKEM